MEMVDSDVLIEKDAVSEGDDLIHGTGKSKRDVEGF